jgi:hypothetical protein
VAPRSRILICDVTQYRLLLTRRFNRRCRCVGHRTSAPPLLSSILLLDLLDLLVDLLAALGVVPVVEEHGASILDDLEFRAHDCETGLDEPVRVRRALILLLPCAGNILVGCEGIVLEHLGVFLDDGHVRLELGEAGVAELVGARQVWVCDGVRALQVGVEGHDKVAVCVGREVDGAGADVGLLERLARVVHQRERVEMLIGALALGVYKVCRSIIG